jgi:hypothetical protein
MLVRDPAWDLISVPVESDGKFAIDGLPPETYAIKFAAKEFEIDGKGVPYQLLGPQSLGLRLRESVEDLHIPLIATDVPRSKPDEANRKVK